MKRKHTYVIYTLLFFSVLIFVICLFFLYFSNRTDSSESIGKITAILNNEQNIFWKDTWKGLRAEAKNQRIALSEYQVTSKESIADYLEIAILSGTDGIIFNASNVHDTESKELLRQAYECGIVLISLDSAYEDVPALCLKIDNVSSSKKIADYILKNSKEEKIILLTYDVYYSSSLQTRFDTVKTSLIENGCQDRLILLEIPNENVEIREYLNHYLKNFEGNAFLVGTGPGQTLISARTVSSLDLSEQFRIIGFGESQEAIDFLKEGSIEALLIQNNQQMGSLAVSYMAEALTGNEVPKNSVFVDSSLYTASTIDTLTQ